MPKSHVDQVADPAVLACLIATVLGRWCTCILLTFAAACSGGGSGAPDAGGGPINPPTVTEVCSGAYGCPGHRSCTGDACQACTCDTLEAAWEFSGEGEVVDIDSHPDGTWYAATYRNGVFKFGFDGQVTRIETGTDFVHNIVVTADHLLWLLATPTRNVSEVPTCRLCVVEIRKISDAGTLLATGRWQLAGGGIELLDAVLGPTGDPLLFGLKDRTPVLASLSPAGIVTELGPIEPSVTMDRANPVRVSKMSDGRLLAAGTRGVRDSYCFGGCVPTDRIGWFGLLSPEGQIEFDWSIETASEWNYGAALAEDPAGGLFAVWGSFGENGWNTTHTRAMDPARQEVWLRSYAEQLKSVAPTDIVLFADSVVVGGSLSWPIGNSPGWIRRYTLAGDLTESPIPSRDGVRRLANMGNNRLLVAAEAVTDGYFNLLAIDLPALVSPP
jgi:hypothetical protein